MLLWRKTVIRGLLVFSVSLCDYVT